MSADKDGKAETAAPDGKRATKTVVGVPTLPDESADHANDLHPTLPIPPKDTAHSDQAGTAPDASMGRAGETDHAPAGPAPRPAGVAGALPRPATRRLGSTKTLPPSADMFHGRERVARQTTTPEKATRPGLAATEGPPSKGRSTLLLDSSAPSGGERQDLDPSKERPPIVVPASRAMPAKAVTQAPPWSEGAVRMGPPIPRASPPRAPEPSIEEISSSLLLSDASGDLPDPGVEELSGSVLLDEAPDGNNLPKANKPPMAAPARVSVKPPVPKSRSGRPPEAAHRALLGGADLPPAAPTPVLDPGAPAPATTPKVDLGAPSAASAPTLDFIAAPPTPAPKVDASAAPASPSPATQVEAAPVEEGAASPPETSALEVRVPPAPVTGDIEITRLPRSGVAPVLDAVRGALQAALGRLGGGLRAVRSAVHGARVRHRAHGVLRRARHGTRLRLRELADVRGALHAALNGVRARLQAQGALAGGGRPKWFLPLVAGAGLLVGIGLFAMLGSLIRGGGGSALARDPGPLAQPAASALPPAAATSTPSVVATAPVPAMTTAPSPRVWSACTVSGTPHVIGPSATVPAGVEVVRLRDNGDDVALGFAPSDHDAVGVRLQAASLSATSTVRARSRDVVRRVTPMANGRGSLSLAVDTDAKNDCLQGRRTVIAEPPVQLGTADGHVAWARLGAVPSGDLWPLDEGGDVESMRGAAGTAGDTAIALAFRRGGAVWMGVATGTTALTPKGALGRIDGLGTTVGSPAIAISEGGVMVAWSDRPSSEDPWRLRWTRFDAGSAPSTPVTFAPPAGGKGGQAMSPSLTALPGGRFLLVWTEGPASGHDVRALTLGPDGTAVGAPLVISNPGVNAGQGQAAVTAKGPGIVAFLESGGDGFQVVATPIACGE